MTTEIIFEVIEKLIGEIEPQADSTIDRKRLENTEKLLEIFDKIHTKLDDVAYRHKDSPYASVKNIVRKIENQLNIIYNG